MGYVDFRFFYCIRITGLDDHDKDENIEESIKTVHKFLTKTVKMEIKESDINIAHRLGPFRPRQNRPVIVACVLF
jgi:alcohol dehydrogenase YqhD (iron-dependent ADH family)